MIDYHTANRLYAFAAKALGLSCYPANVPHVIELADVAMHHMAGANIKAFYGQDSGLIYVTASVPEDEKYGLLVHEFVHALQDWKGMLWPEFAQDVYNIEFEAHQVQRDFYRRHGINHVLTYMDDQELADHVAALYEPHVDSILAMYRNAPDNLRGRYASAVPYGQQPEDPDYVQACKIEVPRVKRPLPETPQEHVQRVRRLTGRDGTA